MTEEIERGHQQNRIDARTPVRLQDRQCVGVRRCESPTRGFQYDPDAPAKRNARLVPSSRRMKDHVGIIG